MQKAKKEKTKSKTSAKKPTKPAPKKAASKVIAKAAPKAVRKPVKLTAPKAPLKKKEGRLFKKKLSVAEAPLEKAAVLEKPVLEAVKVHPQVRPVVPPAKPAPAVAPTPKKPALKELELKLPITVKDLSVRLQEKPSLLIKALMEMKVMAAINQALEEATVAKICEKYGYQIKKAPDEEELALMMHQEPDSPKLLRPRAPIVTLMGHVDHGKTSLLDAIRKTKVAEFEQGGITQHIGAYRVALTGGEITFLDTPGHEAFTAMRARGAKVTDIVILVVAADDGVMPQTKEAIDHARAAGVNIIVAINKIDKPQANLDRVKKQLADLNLKSEDWGGKTITVPVSAKTGQGIDDLLEMILLQAQVLELKANPQRPAHGVVIEAKMSEGRGPVATLLIQNGTLRLNENIIVGKYYAKARAMFDSRGLSLTECGPSIPVEVLGLSGVPQAGESFFVIEDEKKAKELAILRQEKEKQAQAKTLKRISLEDLHAQIQAGKIKELKLIIKADVQGSLEAIKQTLIKLNVSEIKLDFIHEDVGNINSSDVILAVASNALILGFHVVADERAKELIAKEGIDTRIYNIIYELANDIKAAIEGMLEPKLKKVFLGRAEVRKVFNVSRAGTIAGCFVNKGKIMRTSLINLVRNGEAVFEGKVSSLKRFKDDVREVLEGFECGIALGGFADLKEGDIIEAYEIEKIARKL
jgi:translation initiation factor IF-2